MSLGAGARIGVYEVIAAIGAGGMGEVYRARDTRLKREVALKILPASFADDPDRLARFQREAEVLASLNHPNIAAIYGLEEGADVGAGFSRPVQALVMELVEGETLADRIARGAIPVDEALPIAKQIAEALEAAHEQGIIHRDLKPANIKVKPGGTVKVLDFGLAKLNDPNAPNAPNVPNDRNRFSISPTITSPALMTGINVLLGTAAYMSPEQAKGKPADKRSDIWAFGCVLFEMLTGRRAFEGDDVSETLAAVLKSQPDLTKVPPKLRTLVTACLEKDPRKRLRDIGDAHRLVSEDLPAPTRRRWSAAAGIAAMVLLVTIAMIWLMTRPQDRSLIRLDVDLGPDAVSVGTNDVLISPDGTLIVFSMRTATGRPPQLATRRLDASVATPLPGTEDAQFPFFSPNSQWIGFFANRRLQKVSVQGGAPVTLSDAPNVLGASWGDDGYIVAGIDVNRGLVRIPESGGTPQPITELNAGEVHGLPQVLAGAQVVIFTARPLRLNSLSDANVEAVSVSTRQRKKLVSRGYFGQYIPSMRSTGHLVYVSDGVLSGMQFDPSRLELQSEPVALIDGVPASSFARAGSFSFSTTGTFVYRRESAAVATSQVMWLENSGKTESLLSKPAAYYNPYFSPDGQRLAVTLNSDRGRDIYVYDPARDVMTRITYDGRSQNTVWAPDGRHLLYWHQSPAGYAIVYQRADGAAEPVVLLESKNIVVPTSFSPDRRLLYFEIDPQTRQDLWTLPLDFTDAEHPKAGKPEPFLRTRFMEFEPAFSPDGRWVAYRYGETDNTPIFVRPYPGPSGQWQISAGGSADRNPMWSPDGKQLFYESGDNRIMVVDYTASGDSFQAGKPRLWADFRTAAIPAAYDVTLAPDGKRFVVVAAIQTQSDEAGSVHANFLFNFFDELRRRVRAK